MISETAAAAAVAETAAIPETATIAEAAAVQEAAVAEAIAETAIAEGRVQEATVTEATAAVTEATNAGEVNELSVRFTGLADDFIEASGTFLNIEASLEGAIERCFRHVGERGAGEGHNTRRGNCPSSEGSQQGTTRQFLVHGSTAFFRCPSF